MSRIAFIVLALAATPAFAELHQGSTPPVGQEAVASVGSDVYEKFHYFSVPGVVSRDEIARKIMLARVDAPPGAKWVIVKEKPILKACYLPEGVPAVTFTFMMGCAVDDDLDGIFDRVAGNNTQGAVKMIVPVPYTRTEIQIPQPGDIRQKLIYLGVNDKALRLSYREFSGDMARPAFTEELTFPLAATLPQTIKFRDVSLSLDAIDAEGMHYHILPQP